MNFLVNYPKPQWSLHSLTNVILFCAKHINDFDVTLSHHQAFDSNGNQRISSLESGETVILQNGEQNVFVL